MKKFFVKFKNMFWLFAITFSLVVVSCAPSRYVAQQDSDDDGVPDVWDKCDLASGTWDNCGCPEPVKIVKLAPTVSDVGAPLVRDLGITDDDRGTVQKKFVDIIWLLLTGELANDEVDLVDTEFKMWDVDLNQKQKEVAKALGNLFKRFYEETKTFPQVNIIGHANYVAYSDFGSNIPDHVRKVVNKNLHKGEKEIGIIVARYLSDTRAENFFNEVNFKNENLSFAGAGESDHRTTYTRTDKKNQNRILTIKRLTSAKLLGSTE